MHKHLILGGARSGKSHFANQLAKQSELPVLFIATAQAMDSEMEKRINIHQKNRPHHWQLIEEPLYLANVIQSNLNEKRFIIVDCLTLWLTNLLLHPNHDILLDQEPKSLFDILKNHSGHITLVGNETGLGIIPMGEINRRFVDENGRLHQQMATLCDQVTLMVAGLPMTLKGTSHP